MGPDPEFPVWETLFFVHCIHHDVLKSEANHNDVSMKLDTNHNS